jgi:hypothetical protein
MAAVGTVGAAFCLHWLTCNQRGPIPSRPEWAPVARFATAFRDLVTYEKRNLDDLLRQSDERLGAFSDPLRLSFEKHRWLDLRGEREESYSDWLAWLLEELDSTEALLKIFGLEKTKFGDQVRGARPQLDREKGIRDLGGERKTT